MLAAGALGAMSAIDRELLLIQNLFILRDIIDRALKDEPRVVGDDAYSMKVGMTGGYILVYV